MQIGSSSFLLTASVTATAVLSEGDVILSTALKTITKTTSSTIIRTTMALDFMGVSSGLVSMAFDESESGVCSPE
jgi:hypothetical protein